MKPSDPIRPISDRQSHETRALLKILALGERQIASGEVQPAAEVIARLRKKQPTG